MASSGEMITAQELSLQYSANQAKLLRIMARNTLSPTRETVTMSK
jgi:hypothetical protein